MSARAVSLVALALLATACGDAAAKKDGAGSTTVSAPRPALDIPLTPFELVDQDGKPFKSADLDGKVWIANFIFTTCQAVCPELTRIMASLVSKYASEPDVRFVSVTVDADNDTPPKLREFALKNGATSFDRWTFLTGPTDKVDATVLQNFKMAMQRNSGMAISHAERFSLVDRRGHIRGVFSVKGEGNELDALDTALRALLSEPAK
ncbi:MAG: SCO family protein [Polyangiaceae bacterium]